MFQLPVQPFLTKAHDLYTSTAFDVPPCAVAAPPPEPAWVSYDGPKDLQSREYKRFRASSSFRLAHQQWLDRLQDCATFARQHCTPSEYSHILEGLRVLKERLVVGYGEDYVGIRMPLLFGDGKRAMDRLCQRLKQEELPLDFRCTALRQLADNLHLCLSTGPAFIQAASALDQVPAGLRTEFLAVVQQRSDAVLQQSFRHDFPDSAWEDMEVHAVNGLRIILGLPGADPSDTFSFSEALYKNNLAGRSARKLCRSIHPAEVAQDLSERFLGRLQSRLPPHLQSMAPEQDLNDHMPALRAVVDELSVGFAPVSLHSLLQEDEATGEFHWRADPSLLTLDLLRAMVAEGVAQPLQPQVLATRRDAEREWRLERVGTHLFYAMESCPPGADAVPMPVACEHVAAWVSDQDGDYQALPSSLVLTLVKSERPDQLHHIPGDWLSDDEQVRIWLSRLGPQGFERWLMSMPSAPESMLKRLLPALTDQGMARALHRLSEVAPIGATQWLRLAGQDILTAALRQPCPETLLFWQRIVHASLMWMARAEAYALLTPATGANLLSTALATGRAGPVRAVGELLSRGIELGVVTMPVSLHHLDSPVQEAMRRGHIAALTELGHFLQKAANFRWMEPATRQAALEGPKTGLGCTGAMEGGHAECVTWFFDLVEALEARKLLSTDQVQVMLCNDLVPWQMAGSVAIARRHTAALKTYLQRLIQAADKGLIPAGRLPRLLSCSGPQGAALERLLSQRLDAEALNVWCEAVLEAEAKHLISTQWVEALLSGREQLAPTSESPPLFWLLVKRYAGPETLGTWAEVVARFHRAGALSSKQVEHMLRASFRYDSRVSTPVLHVAMATWGSGGMASDCVDIYGWAKGQKVISAKQLQQLLCAPTVKGGTPALNAAVAHGYQKTAAAFLDALIRLAERKQLSPDALLRLMDGRSEAGQSAVHTAVRWKWLSLLDLLFSKLILATQKRLIGEAQWNELLFPQEGTDSVVRLIVQHRLEGAANIVHNAVLTANGLQALSAGNATTLIRYLDGARPRARFPARS